MIVLLIICAILLITLIRMRAEKEHWLKMYIEERKRRKPDMWYSGKDGTWNEVYF